MFHAAAAGHHNSVEGPHDTPTSRRSGHILCRRDRAVVPYTVTAAAASAGRHGRAQICRSIDANYARAIDAARTALAIDANAPLS
jgi:hypothetical protein